MINDSGHTATGRADEVAHYVEAVREALADLPSSVVDELLEDLPAHLTEVAAEDPSPLTDRLGSASAYADELRSAAVPAAAFGRPPMSARLEAQWERLVGRLRRLDARVGPLLGYERFSDFARLLLPAWWVLRGYLAAMVVVTTLDRQGTIGLLPRLGGSTLAGVVILAGFVAGSIWLAHRTPGLRGWQRRALHLTSAVLVLVGIAGLAGIDSNRRWGWPGPSVYADRGTGTVYLDPYENVEDVLVVDENGQLLTNVRLLDQDGNPLDIGWSWCDETEEYDELREEWFVRYPRCPEELPWWARGLAPPGPTAEPTPGPTAEPTAEPTPEPSAEPTLEPSAESTPEPTAEPSD